jgi:hypothetical protein
VTGYEKICNRSIYIGLSLGFSGQSTAGVIELTLAAGAPLLRDLDLLLIAEPKIPNLFVCGMLWWL